MVTVVTVDELKERAEEILQRVREQGETIEVAEAGEVVAQLVPRLPRKRGLSPEDAAVLDDLEQLAIEIGKEWPPGMSAAEAVKEQRREL